MFLKSVTYRNVGPLRSANINLPFHEDGHPKPLVIVGRNGSGKSILISNIADALVECASKAYVNVRPSLPNSRSQFFKSISPQEITIGQNFMIMHARFDNGHEYVFKSGSLNFDDANALVGHLDSKLNWEDKINHKLTTFDEADASAYLRDNVICYFGPNRYEIPSWMGNLYLNSPEASPAISSTIRQSDTLYNQIVVQCCLDETVNWLLDVIADSRSDFTRDSDDENTYSLVHVNLQTASLSQLTRRSIEMILSVIFGENVYLRLNQRGSGHRRLQIASKADEHIVCPSLKAMSTGQIALFELFATIIRYADNNHLGSELLPKAIKGIVIIDEADLHLHADLQRIAFPALLELFSSVQFVITTHSPLLLLGLSDKLGEEGLDDYFRFSATSIS
ncbi:MAG: AAA family ATPase [Eggerthellaceae bacterium]|nr:AAA family ATPase [Eggerthellaceae bacterium]